MNVLGKVALVATGTSGFGLATCEALARDARVAVLGQRIDAGRAIAARLPGAIAVQANITARRSGANGEGVC